MRNLFRKIQMPLLCILLVFPACSDENAEKYITNTGIEEDASGTFISKEKVNISENDAAIVASKFFSGTETGTARIAAMLNTQKTVSCVVDKDNNPAMYIVNYANNGGFVIISATKNYQPVLAYSDKGHFDISRMNDGAALLFGEYQTAIADINDSEIDSLRARFAVNWAQFEEPDKPTATVALSTIEYKKQQEIAKWTALGYECYNLSMARYLMSPDLSEGYIRDICAHTNPKYNCMDVTVLLVKRSKAQYGPLLKTEWSQREPFNVAASNRLAGCVPIAMAQIMKYHEWPARYKWNEIPAVNPPLNAAVRYFILDIRDYQLEVKYNNGGTSSTAEKARDAFENLGYSAQLKDYYGYSERWTVAREVMAGRPVYLSGQNTEPGSGHAWVCDGYKHEQMQFAAAMLMFDGPGDGESYEFFGGLTETSGQYLHMNWGHGPDYQGGVYWGQDYHNGWFYNDYVKFQDGQNFADKRKMILINPKK